MNKNDLFRVFDEFPTYKNELIEKGKERQSKLKLAIQSAKKWNIMIDLHK